MDEARSTLSKLLAAQEHERKEIEKQMAEEARHIQQFQADYQRRVGDQKESEVVIQSVEQIIATAQIIIAKAQVLIEANENKLAAARKRLEDSEATKKLVQEDLTAHSSRLESFQAQLATKRFLFEEELRVQALVEADRARQHEIHRLREQIHSLAKQDY